MKKYIKYTLLSVTIAFLLSGCLESKETSTKTFVKKEVSLLEQAKNSNKMTSKEKAIKKIQEYANSNGTSQTPTIEDYKVAGVEGVESSSKLKEVNDKVATLNKEDVDSAQKINAILKSLNISSEDLKILKVVHENLTDHSIYIKWELNQSYHLLLLLLFGVSQVKYILFNHLILINDNNKIYIIS